MNQHIKIGSRLIGPEEPVYIIAELSANHGGSLEAAKKLIHAAKAAGADAIKIQTYRPDTITIDCDNEYFRIKSGTIWDGRTLYDLYKEAYTPWEWHADLMTEAKELDFDFFSSPFDHTAVDFLEELGVPAYKVASFELVDIPLIQKIARTKKPMIMSTGMASLAEIDEAVRAAKDAGCAQLALLKTNSGYPAPPDEMNLSALMGLQTLYRIPIGLSDHTLTITVPVAATALGAKIIEKHLILDRSEGGPDSQFSLEPKEFKEMVDAVRETEEALGQCVFGGTKKEESSKAFRRSLFVVKDVKKGELFTHENVKSIRPANGLHTRYLNQVIDKQSVCDIRAGTPLAWQYVLLNSNAE